jgi:hypothetical protein
LLLLAAVAPLQLRVMNNKFFNIHLDVLTEGDLIMRFSFSNIFKLPRLVSFFRVIVVWQKFVSARIKRAEVGRLCDAPAVAAQVSGLSAHTLAACRLQRSVCVACSRCLQCRADAWHLLAFTGTTGRRVANTSRSMRFRSRIKSQFLLSCMRCE